MMSQTRSDPDNTLAGFAVLDDKGRLPVSKALRAALDLRPGSAVAELLIDGMLLVIPQDDQMAQMTERAAAALARAGLTTQDLLDDIPAARAEVVRELYGEALADELARAQAQSAASKDA